MASHVSSRHHVLRDLPRTFVVLVCAALVASLLILFFHYRSPAHRENAVKPQLNELGLQLNELRPQLNEFNIDKRYAGSIVAGSLYEDKCREFILDNRNGNMWDKGYVKCYDVFSQPSEENPPIGMDAFRLREVGKAFRHERR
jgi:hypothetical protein